jgi:hypothetical protein
MRISEFQYIADTQFFRPSFQSHLSDEVRGGNEIKACVEFPKEPHPALLKGGYQQRTITIRSSLEFLSCPDRDQALSDVCPQTSVQGTEAGSVSRF